MNDDIHVTPVNDIKEHIDSKDCWCNPRIITTEGDDVVVHNALDKREHAEQNPA